MATDGTDIVANTPRERLNKERGWLDSYDPYERVIVIILREGGGASGYLIGGRTRPSEAYARQKAKEN